MSSSVRAARQGSCTCIVAFNDQKSFHIQKNLRPVLHAFRVFQSFSWYKWKDAYCQILERATQDFNALMSLNRRLEDPVHSWILPSCKMVTTVLLLCRQGGNQPTCHQQHLQEPFSIMSWTCICFSSISLKTVYIHFLYYMWVPCLFDTTVLASIFTLFSSWLSVVSFELSKCEREAYYNSLDCFSPCW